MPIFNQGQAQGLKYLGKTQTRLFVSGIEAPAEKFIYSDNAAAATEYHFDYEFGYPGNTKVIIPKGKFVELDGQKRDDDSRLYTAIKVSTDSLDKVPFGINMFNVYEKPFDEMKGNLATVVTNGYIELPLFTGAGADANAEAIKYGALWSTAAPTINALVYVDGKGNLTTELEVGVRNRAVGKIVAIENELPPIGFLQYFLDMDNTIWNQFMKEAGINKKAPTSKFEAGSPLNDFGTFPGDLFYKHKEDLMRAFNNGIPYLTDGYNMKKTSATVTAGTLAEGQSNITDIKTTQGVFAGGTFTIEAGQPMGAMFVKFDSSKFKLRVPDAKDGETKTVIATGANVVEAHADIDNNLVIVYFKGTSTPTINVLGLDMTKPAGIPTNWDFAGASGGARILFDCNQF